MHELAIAKKVIDTATALLPPDMPMITTLCIQLGALAGVSEEELRFGIAYMAAGTACEGATVEITTMPALAHCLHCDVDFAIDETDILFCPACNSPVIEIVQGKELLITSIQVSDELVSSEAGHHELVNA